MIGRDLYDMWLKTSVGEGHRYVVGIQIRNMKMVFNIYGTWHRVTFEKLMMKIYDFFLFVKVV